MNGKAKNLLVSILIGLAYIGGGKDFIISIFGEHSGVIALAFVALAYTLTLAVLKTFYNSSNAPSNWTYAQIVFNVCSFGLLVIGMVHSWSIENSVSLNGGFIDMLTKISIYCNLGLGMATTDWSQFRNKVLEDIDRP